MPARPAFLDAKPRLLGRSLLRKSMPASQSSVQQISSAKPPLMRGKSLLKPRPIAAPKLVTDPKKYNPRTWRIERREDGWWLTHLPEDCTYEGCGEMGPAKDREQIEDMKRGLIQFLEEDQYVKQSEN
jgi:hypothetical protein